MSQLLGRFNPLWDFYNQLLDGVILLDEQDILVDCNHSANRLLDLVSLKGKQGLGSRFIASPSIDGHTSHHQLIDGKKKLNGNVKLSNGDGWHKESSYQCFFIADDVTNEHMGKLVFFHDPEITLHDPGFFSRKTELLHALNGCTSELVSVVNLKQQSIDFANHYTCEILGWACEDFIEGGFPFVLSIVHPQDIEIIRNSHYYLNATSGDTSSPIHTYTIRLRMLKGNYVNIQFTESVLERDADGSAALLLVFGRPVMEPHIEAKLTPREIEVARLLVQGQSSKMIAATFNLSIHTVNDYRAQLMKKLGTTNTAALVNYLIEKKLL